MFGVDIGTNCPFKMHIKVGYVRSSLPIRKCIRLVTCVQVSPHKCILCALLCLKDEAAEAGAISLCADLEYECSVT